MRLDKELIWANVISLLIFVLILISINSSIILSIDLSIYSLFQILQNSFLIDFSKLIEIIFDPINIVIFSIILTVILWLKDSKKEYLFFALVNIISAIVIFILKEVIRRGRPVNFIETDFSFPSGHVAMAVVFFFILIYLILRSRSYILPVVMVFLISFTRLYLNVHWFTDIIAGLALGMFIFTLSIIIDRKWEIST